MNDGQQGRLERVEDAIGGLRADLNGFRAEVRGELSQLRDDVGDVRGEVGNLREEGGDLRGDVGNLRGEVGDLRRHMGVLHEQTMDAIRALAPDFAPIRREFTAADAALEDRLDRRIVPLESYVREHRPGQSRDEG